MLPAAIVAFALPGYAATRLLGSRYRVLTSFCASLIALFHALFWLDLAGVTLSFAPVLVSLLAVAGTAGVAARLFPPHREFQTGRHDEPSPPVLRAAAVVLVVPAVMVMLLRSTLTPLLGPDAAFRWNFLSVQILREHGFAFYPPRAPADFRLYFYPDGIPPLVSFVYWWLYAAVRQSLPAATGLFVTAQYALALAAADALGRRLDSPAAGLWALLAAVACSPLFFAFVLGQETGLTALSLATTLLLLYDADGAPGDRLPIAAGLAAAVGGLSREYGLVVILCGLVVCGCRRQPVRVWVGFALTALAASGPWYVRNWLITGNPIYSNPVDGFFPVNPVHAGFLATYSDALAVSPRQALELLWNVTAAAPVQVGVGLLAGVMSARRLLPLSVSVVVFALVWLASIPYTSGGPSYAARVLSPAFLALSVMAGVGLARWRLPAVAGAMLVALIGGLGFWSLYAHIPQSNSSAAITATTEAERVAARVRARNSRVLSDSAYLHAQMADRGVDVVPVWSPEVAYLFDERVSVADARRRLRAAGIELIEYGGFPLNTRYLMTTPFFRRDAGNWPVFLRSESVVLYRVPAASGQPAD